MWAYTFYSPSDNTWFVRRFRAVKKNTKFQGEVLETAREVTQLLFKVLSYQQRCFFGGSRQVGGGPFAGRKFVLRSAVRMGRHEFVLYEPTNRCRRRLLSGPIRMVVSFGES